MSLPLEWQTVADRLTDYPRDHYLFIGSVMKGVALGMASLVLLEIIADWSAYKQRLLPWLVALFAALVSYTTWGRGVLLTNSNVGILDNIFPLAMGMIEVLMFAILAVRRDDPKNVWLKWPYLVAAHATCAVLLVGNRLLYVDPIADFAPVLEKIARDLRCWMLLDMGGALVTALLAYWAGRGIRSRLKRNAPTDKWQSRWALAFLLIFAIVVVQASLQRDAIDDYVTTHNPSASTATVPITRTP